MVPGAVPRALAAIGRPVRGRTAFALQIAALAWGVVREGAAPATWRRTVRRTFTDTLTRVVGGSLGTVAVAAAVCGLGLVSEALYWLRTAGQQEQIGWVLVVVLVREIAPIFIGIILLGRGGMATVSELGTLTVEGEVAILRAEGLDVFQTLVLPRAAAFAVGAFTLGVLFVLVTLASGFVSGSLAGLVDRSFLGFLDAVVRAMGTRDLATFPVKLLLTGLVVALACCVTGLAAREDDGLSTLMPRGFTRGITSVLATTVLLDVAL